MQRYCDGCRVSHALEAFDLEGDAANSVCKAFTLHQERVSRRAARRKVQAKIEALERRRRGLIAALMLIDQEIAKEKDRQNSLTGSFPQILVEEVGD